MVTATQIVEAVRAALPHGDLLQIAGLVNGALPDEPWDWLTRATELPFVGLFAIAVLMVVCIVSVSIVWALAFLVVLASAVITHSVIVAAPMIAAIVNFVRLAHASVGL
jgi:hypothetical protein